MRRSRLALIVVPVVVFVVGLVVLSALNEPSNPRERRAGGGPQLRGTPPGASTDARIASLQARVRANRGDVGALTALGDAYLQKVRENGDPGLYRKAEGVFRIAARRAPRDPGPLIGLGTLALARHDFRAGLALGERALRLAPALVRPYAVIVDGQVELGRYRDAARSLQRMVDLRPNLASYARVSYLRELRGDLDGAVEAMRLAVSAGGGAPENVAYVQTLVGNLEFARGRPAAARQAYRAALARSPRYVPALAGRARLDAAQRRFAPAIRTLSSLVQRLPLPEYAVALGETQLVAGRRAAARETFALVDVERRLLTANGVNTDVELALFEADHGDARRGVALARRAWGQAPSVRSADAVGWAYTRAGRPQLGLRWARRALRIGSRDPLFLAHAGLSARAADRDAEARRLLRRSLADNPRFSPLWAPRVRRALASLR